MKLIETEVKGTIVIHVTLPEKVKTMHIKPDTYRESVSINFVSDGLGCRLTTAVVELERKHNC